MSVLVHVPAYHDGAPANLKLGPGESVRFGRGTPGQPVGIGFKDAAIPRIAGEIHAVEDHWRLTNFSTTSSYLVENPEGAGEFLRVAPRRIAAPIPFEFARVVLPSLGEAQFFQVYAPAHVYCETPERPDLAGDATLAAFSLDESATYFLILVALCEPRLRDQSVSAVPTTRQLVERLGGLPGCQDISEHSVNFHIDYLARSKLRVRRSAAEGQRMNGKREAVVSVAIRFGLVQEEHLALLPRRIPTTRKPS
ncbi:serine/threonine protein kinase [Streptomyces sp. NPDC060031]|uniref:serine/threonine protein kinase n=1 Tax=Streptomyces sp. NPDC060031 TaxID=3347043 RepID=UPI0036CEFD22